MGLERHQRALGMRCRALQVGCWLGEQPGRGRGAAEKGLYVGIEKVESRGHEKQRRVDAATAAARADRSHLESEGLLLVHLGIFLALLFPCWSWSVVPRRDSPCSRRCRTAKIR